MKRNRVDEAIRRAARLPLSLSLIACGGTVADNAGDAAATGGEAASESPLDAGAQGASRTMEPAADAAPLDSMPPDAGPTSVEGGGSVCTLLMPNMADATTHPIGSCGAFFSWSFPLASRASTCHLPDGGALCALCPSISGSAISCSAADDDAGSGSLTCEYQEPVGDSGASAFGCTGRRPEGLRSSDDPSPRERGAFLAHLAWLEAASVPAFRRLARELEANGGPARLRRAARKAADDEVRHARTFSTLAAKAGALVPAVRVARWTERSLEAIATENAVEGCVRETFGAAVAHVQARRARDRRLRAAMRRIARDEARHARLAWAVAGWIEARLDPQARERVRDARQRARRELLNEVATEAPGALLREFGLPHAAEATAMARSLHVSLV